MRTYFFLICAAAGALTVALPVSAHHAFAAEFDENRPVKLNGTVVKWELVNPHSWIRMNVKDPDGKVTEWMVEGGSPNALLRLGFTKNALPPGTEIIVEGYQAKDAANRAVGANLTFAKDGKRLFMRDPEPGADTNK
jgi:hypothetical protein